MGKPKPAGLVAGKHPYFQRIPRRPPRLQALHRAQRTDDADRAVIVAAFRDRIDMRASRHYRRCRVAAVQPSNDVPRRIHPDLHPHFGHRIHDQPLGFPVRFGIGQAREPRFRLADPSHFFEHRFHPSPVQYPIPFCAIRLNDLTFTLSYDRPVNDTELLSYHSRKLSWEPPLGPHPIIPARRNVLYYQWRHLLC